MSYWSTMQIPNTESTLSTHGSECSSVHGDAGYATNSTVCTSPDLNFIPEQKLNPTPDEEQDLIPTWTTLAEDHSDEESEAIKGDSRTEDASHAIPVHGKRKKATLTWTGNYSEMHRQAHTLKRGRALKRPRMLFNGVVITTPSKASSKPHTGSASPASKTDPISGDTLAAVPTTLRTKGTHSNRPAITARKRKRGLKGESEDETRAICGLRGREVPSSRCRSASPSPDIISSGSVDPDSPTPQQTSLLDAFNTAGRRNEHKPRRSRSASSSVHAESSRLSGHSSTPQPSSLLDAFNAAAQHNKRTRQRLVPYVELVRRTSDSPSPKQRLLRPRKRSSEPRPRYVRDRAPSVVEASDALEQAAPVRLQERLREETGSEDALILMNTRWLRQALEERSPPKVEDEVYPTRMVDHSSKAVRFVAMLEECYGPGTRIPSAVDAKPKKGVLKVSTKILSG
ncbi:hypothetical protein OE88DRAFT_722017 [Heliocybe sulcata]|uniref:Uncharacterized protein n=1 Tax=Heliocybe sulcata TaxID=5364 RepID=A0A5C3NER0_9AGAM|nr:hypothetical protein OE88DRAFT_722017 [Heliocybe sulcata]